jgi:hypothetical protein
MDAHVETMRVTKLLNVYTVYFVYIYVKRCTEVTAMEVATAN